MMGQLTLMQSFVEDLLNLRLLKEGTFTLANEPFNPKEVFDMICSIFTPQTSGKGI